MLAEVVTVITTWTQLKATTIKLAEGYGSPNPTNLELQGVNSNLDWVLHAGSVANKLAHFSQLQLFHSVVRKIRNGGTAAFNAMTVMIGCFTVHCIAQRAATTSRSLFVAGGQESSPHVKSLVHRLQECQIVHVPVFSWVLVGVRDRRPLSRPCSM